MCLTTNRISIIRVSVISVCSGVNIEHRTYKLINGENKNNKKGEL